LTELVTAFVQDKPTIERGLFDEELVPEELTQVRMGKIIKEKFPNLEEEDREAIRQHAIAALTIPPNIIFDYLPPKNRCSFCKLLYQYLWFLVSVYSS
jgi:hypothetical protein